MKNTLNTTVTPGIEKDDCGVCGEPLADDPFGEGTAEFLVTAEAASRNSQFRGKEGETLVTHAGCGSDFGLRQA